MSRADGSLRRLGDSFRIEVSRSTREQHLAAISTAVRTTPPSRTVPHLGLRRRVATVLAALTAVVAPVGTAVAAEGALPDEVLYPVKQFTEQIRAVFDDELPARHRIEELEGLLDGDADPSVIAGAQVRAEEAVGALDQPGELAGRLDRVREQVRSRIADDSADVPPGAPDPQEPGEGPGTTAGPGPNDDRGSGSEAPGPGGSPGDADGGRGGDGSGDGGGSAPPTTGPGGGDGSGGSAGSGGGDGGDGAGSGSSGDGSGGEPRDGDSGGAGDGGGGNGSGSSVGAGTAAGTGTTGGNGTGKP